jgi:D-glycero-alpha-D-manno-heptose 1-phosphate guanylyltransferase
MTTAIVLAGGLGTRLREAVPDLPKPMAPVNGRPFLEYLLDYWIEQGVERFVISVGYLHQLIVDHFGYSYRGVKVDYSIEKSPLGTGGALLLASSKLKSNHPFLLLNGDTYFAVDLGQLLDFSSANQADWCFSILHSSDQSRYLGLDLSSNGTIRSFNASAPSDRNFVNGGVYLVHPNSLPKLAQPTKFNISLEQDLFPIALEKGQKFVGLEFTGTFIDIGIPSDYQKAQSIFKS